MSGPEPNNLTEQKRHVLSSLHLPWVSATDRFRLQVDIIHLDDSV